MRIYAKKVNRLLAESKNMLTFAIVMLGQASAVIARNQVPVHPPLSKLAGYFVLQVKNEGSKLHEVFYLSKK